ncbi:MAG: hypothetical protein KDC44_12670 [Phaeodactylibacter sp.]|nr:hypothetical protein [Phaeodactylibacter sp.]
MKNLLLVLCLGIAWSGFTTSQAVSFTLRNESLVAIPLEIPGVMKPNLSPMSNSGVSLEVGQKIFFRHQSKKYLLLEVSKNLEGEKILVNQLIKARKKELGL